MIDWKSLFDAVYCVHYVPQQDKLDGLMDELKRVGLLGSEVLHMRYTYPSRYNRILMQAQGPAYDGDPTPEGIASLCREFTSIVQEARFKGYGKILMLENDVRFLRDLDRLDGLFRSAPDVDLVQFDKFVYPGGETMLSDRVRDHSYNSDYFDPGPNVFYSGACFSLKDSAYDKMIAELEGFLQAPDSTFSKLYHKGVTRAVATRNLAVQVVYKGTVTESLYGVNSHHDGYVRGGLTDYADYAVPPGYKYGSAAGDVVNTSVEHKLRIHVYAITKNESKFVDRWVDSMKEADGIHVLDTGSTDDTVERLRARGVHVEVKTYDPWRFDVPRNDSMALCPDDADILVCTDLDEILRPGWRGKLETQWVKALEEGKNPMVARYDYIWSFQPDGTPARQFRYEKIHVPHEYEWRYAVHELLFRKDNGPTEYLETEGIMLEHHPDKSKSRGSYLGLLKLSVEEDPTNDRNTHYYARELTFYGKWDEAIEWHRKFLDMGGWSAERAASHMYVGRCHWNLGRKHEAEQAWIKGEREDPNHREAAFEALRTYYEAGDWDSAIRHGEALFRVKHMTDDYVTDREAWGWKPYDMLGIALWYAGRRDGAREVFSIAVDKFPENEHLRDNLRRCRSGEWAWIV